MQQAVRYVFLHGLGQTSGSWQKTIETMGHLSESFCPDLPAWLDGCSPCYENLYQKMETACRRFPEPIHLCGLSLGGVLSLQYGIEHPERVRSLVLIGTPYTMPKRLLQVQNLIFRLMPERAFSQTGLGKRGMLRLSQSMTRLDFRQDLGKIQCPVLVVCGGKDRANRSAAVALTERIAHAELVTVAGAGHEVNRDAPDKLGKVLSAFFEVPVKEYIREIE